MPGKPLINEMDAVSSVLMEAGVATVVKRAAEQGKLEGRNKIQSMPQIAAGSFRPLIIQAAFLQCCAAWRFEIISADYIVTASEDVYLLEFNTGA